MSVVAEARLEQPEPEPVEVEQVGEQRLEAARLGS